MNCVLNISRREAGTATGEGTDMAMERWRPFGSVERWDPFRGLGDIQTEVNRLFDSVSGRSAGQPVGDRMWLPAVDVHETKDEFVLSFDLPGVTEKDVHISITG